MDPAAQGSKLHLGCGPRAVEGWVNVDGALGARLARFRWLRPLLRRAFDLDWPADLTIHDLRRPFPWADASAAAIYSSHTVEHLSLAEGRAFLGECARVLAPGGVVRIVVPDLAAILSRLEKGEIRAVELLDHLDVATTLPGDPWWKRMLAPAVRFPHRCMYDAACLLEEIGRVGLEARSAAPFVSRIPDIAELETHERTRDSLIVEALKPAGESRPSVAEEAARPFALAR